MRTTVDLPEDLLDLAKSLARGRKQTLSHVIADLMRRGINPPAPPQISISPVSGFPVLHTGGPTLTAEDVRALEEEDDEYLASFIKPRAAAK